MLAVVTGLAAFLFFIAFQLNQRLDQMAASFQQTGAAMGAGLGTATSVVGQVQQTLGRLETSNLRIIEISKDISSLQDLLRAPKMRGQIGEMFLENILAQVLPSGYYAMQHRFRSGEAVDAAVKIGGKIVPVDAKFSLENFRKISEAATDGEKNAARRKFTQDTKNRIDEIAAKYIVPEENTFDFALMYVPAENVYYEIVIKEDIFTYCVERKVIPVSPNTLYAYLQVICLGLRGMKIEQNAQEIIGALGTLTQELRKFREDFELAGQHISNACKKYEDGLRRLDRFQEKFTGIQETEKTVNVPI